MIAKRWGIPILVLALAASAGWAAQSQPVKIGLAVGITGDISVYGEPIRNGFMLAFKQINDKGQVKIDPILEDTGGGRDGAINVFQKFIQRDQVAAILGPVLSSQAFGADPLAVQAGVPVVGVSNTAKGIPQIGPTIFRVSAPEAVQIPKSIAVAKATLNLQRVVVLYDNADDFTVSGYKTFAEELQKNGIQIADTITFARGDSDFSAQLTKAKAANPQAIVVSALAREGTLLLIQAHNLGITVPFIGGNGFNDTNIITRAGAAAEGLIVGTAWVPSAPTSVNLKFYDSYRATYKKEPNQFAAQAYAGALVVAEAVRRANLTGGEDIKAQRGRIAQALTTIKNFETPLGRISIGPDRDVIQPRTYVAVVRGGRFVELTPSK
ncbi:MAG TPA: ABC transporter substrate-binding protein [bacterium]|nr:ABC transporter substrate-binding protein [bacterium]